MFNIKFKINTIKYKLFIVLKHIYNKNYYMRKKLKESEKKGKLTASINKEVLNKLNTLHNNVSKHVEWLIYRDLRKNNQIDEIPL
jgi:hypothetical protein